MLEREAVSFDDVLIRPTYSCIESRLSVDTSVDIAGINISIPLISSPMDTVTESKMCIDLGLLGGLGILHRFASYDEREREILKIIDFNDVSRSLLSEDQVPLCFAIGVSDAELDFAHQMYDNYGDGNINAICIDVANGHSSLVKKALDRAKSFGAKVIAGNIATEDGYYFLCEHGADAVRVGIGGGSICMTRIQTGIGVPTLQSVLDCSRSKYSESIPIIADGGIKYPADLCKALIAGASAVVCGNIFAGTTSSPGSVIIDIDGKKYKKYRGMASEDVQKEKRGSLKPGTVAEGVSTIIPLSGDGSLSNVVSEFVGGLRSSMTYVNSLNLDEYIGRQNLLLKITNNGLKESHAYGTHRR
jgi:IMP dehydrogenase